MGKFKKGTRVVPTRECMKWYRNHLGEGYATPSGEMSAKAYPEVVMWAMSDKFTPTGKVIAGNPAEPETTVRVVLESPFGYFVGYLDKDHLLVKKRSQK